MQNCQAFIFWKLEALIEVRLTMDVFFFGYLGSRSFIQKILENKVFFNHLSAILDTEWFAKRQKTNTKRDLPSLKLTASLPLKIGLLPQKERMCFCDILLKNALIPLVVFSWNLHTRDE